MIELFRAILWKNALSGDGIEGVRKDTATVVGNQLVAQAFPNGNPVLQGALTEKVTARLSGQPVPNLSAAELKERVGDWAADTWIDNNFPALEGPARDTLYNAIVGARGW